MDWSEEETNYEEDVNCDLDNYKPEKIASTYEELKNSGKNIVEKYIIPYTSDAGYDRLKKETKRKNALKKRIDYILNNCEKYGFNQTNKIILEHAIDEGVKPKAECKRIDFSVENDGEDYDWIVKSLGVLPGDSFFVCGESFTGKTHLASYFAICISAGIPIFGKFSIDKSGPVAHVNYDSDEKLTITGYRRLAKGLGIKTPIIDYYDKPTWKFNHDVAYENLTKICTGKVACVVDSFRACFDGNEDSSEITSPVIALANKVSSETGCAIIFISHPGKNGTKGKDLDAIRGSGGIAATAGTIWILEKMSEDRTVKFRSVKERSCERMSFCYRYDNVGEMNLYTNKTVAIDMTILGDDAPVMQKKLTIREQVVAALKKGSLSSGDLNKEITGNQSSICDELKKMETEGYLKKEKDGKLVKYSLTDKGEWL